MNTKTPLISVVIPAYNEENELPHCLYALTKQNLKEKVEVIVVNNNSTDKTEDIAKSYKARIVRENRQGLIFAKQAGCEKAVGKIIAVLDADNVPPKHWLRTIVELLSDNEVAAVTGPYIIPKTAPWWARLHTTIGIELIEIFQFLTHTSPHLWGGNVAFRKKDFKKVGGYDTKFTFAADEVKLRKDLSKLGRIHHVRALAVTTSARRLKKGAYHFYVEFLLKGYILNYLTTLLLNKPLKHPENVREEGGSDEEAFTREP